MFGYTKRDLSFGNPGENRPLPAGTLCALRRADNLPGGLYWLSPVNLLDWPAPTAQWAEDIGCPANASDVEIYAGIIPPPRVQLCSVTRSQEADIIRELTEVKRTFNLVTPHQIEHKPDHTITLTFADTVAGRALRIAMWSWCRGWTARGRA